QLREELDLQDRSIWFTGHSLGAALAAVAALRLGGSNVQGVYTFGSPRAGTEVFRSAFDNRFADSCFRLEHGSDIITQLPPTIPLLLNYRPVGTQVYISSDGEVGGQSDRAAILLDQIRGQITLLGGSLANILAGVQLPIAAIADHAPIYYA